jgi:hypothetical protein
MCGEGFVSGGRKGFESGFNHREISFGNDSREELGFESHHEEERGFPGYRMEAMIVGKLRLSDQI